MIVKKKTNDLFKPLAQELFSIFKFLKEQDFTGYSATSKLLRENPDHALFQARMDEELEELEGVIAGSHAHTDNQKDDVIFESGQVFYWLCLWALTFDLDNFEKFWTNQLVQEVLSKLTKACQKVDADPKAIFERELALCREKKYLQNYFKQNN